MLDANIITCVLLISLVSGIYYFIVHTYYKKYLQSDSILRSSIIIDALILFPLIYLMMATSLLHFSVNDLYNTPWIFTSAILLFVVTLCVFTNLLLSIFYYFKLQTTGIYRLHRSFHLINAIEIFLLLSILYNLVKNL